MYVLIRSETNIDRRVAHSSEQLCSGVFVEHPLTERTKFLPLEATVLMGRSDIRIDSDPTEISIRTMNCLFRRATGKFP